MSLEAFAAAWTAGRQLPLAEALAEQLADDLPAPATTPPVRRVASAAARHRLTRRELEVMRLLVEGRTDRAIAEALSITYRTTTTNVTNILTKLNGSSRTAATTYAVLHHLLVDLRGSQSATANEPS